ncbi:MAG TPA: SLC13 family permease [Candidatus Limnocylindrales bacterium]|nr:SLC13 family permease [Candidatus Limnocylindrales bacterium]
MDWSIWGGLGWQAWLTMGVVVAVLLVLALTQLATDLVLVGGVGLLLLTGVLAAGEAFAGLSNQGIMTITVLYVVVAGLEATGGNVLITEKFLSRPRTITGALAKMMFPVTFISAFMNNTPVVAMFMPAVNDWAKKNDIPVSKLMIPLSYAAILSGTITIISTATNLLVDGMLRQTKGHGMHMFELFWISVPITIGGCLFVIATHRWLLPDRRPALSTFGDPREYTIEMSVDPNGPLVGKSIEAAGLRQLPQCFLAEIEREGEILAAVGPDQRLHANDRLIFVGVVDAMVDLQRIRGLSPATDQIFKLDAPRSYRSLIEAVVADDGPLVGRSIRDAQFRSVYNAAVIAVARRGERIRRKIGDIVLRGGDTLLLEAHQGFAKQHHNSHHFYLVSRVEGSTPVRYDRAFLAIAILIGMMVIASLEWLPMLHAAMLAAGLLLLTGCMTSTAARESVEWNVIIAVAAAFALGIAIEKTGVAKALALSLTEVAQGDAWMSLAGIYLCTLLLTELVSHSAAVSLTFPIAIQTAANLGVGYMPFVAAVTVAGSLGFATPLGYQTHMMVYGAGGYRFTDFLRIGVPMDILCAIIAIAMIPLVLPFTPLQ